MEFSEADDSNKFKIILDLATHYCPFPSVACLLPVVLITDIKVVSSFVALLPLAQLAILASLVSRNHFEIGSRFSRRADFLIVIVRRLRLN